MAMIVDAVVGKLLDELLKEVGEMKDRAVKFRPTLEHLESTLKTAEPLAKRIDALNKGLDKPDEGTQKLIDMIKKGKKLVKDCSKAEWWNCCYKADYQTKLQDLDESIREYFNLDMQGQNQVIGLENQVIGLKNQEIGSQNREIGLQNRGIGLENQVIGLQNREIGFENQVIGLQNREIGFETRVMVTQMHQIIVENGPRRTQLKEVCTPPEPPAFIVGLDDALRELKLRVLNDHHGGSVITVTGTGGLGKSTLAKMFCRDEEVKGKFKENIFFVPFAREPKLIAIVQRLFQHCNCEVPEFRNDDDAAIQLELLFKKIGKSPILLVLDDVWEESVSLVHKFVFHQIPNYKILVTSRVSNIKGFGQPAQAYVLKPLNEADAIELFRHSACLNQSSSDIPDDVVQKIARGCSGSPLALTVSGGSLSLEPPVVWHNRAKKLSEGSILAFHSSKDVLTCLQKSFEDLDPKVTECFRDLSLFPEAQRIPAAALIDIWAELRDEDDDTAMENIYELVKRSMAEIVVTRNTASGTVDYNYHYVTQHGLLRELAIHQTSQEKPEKRNRLIIDISGNNLTKWWTTQNENHIAARTLSISTNEEFTSEWCNLQPTKVEVLVLNLREKKRSLPMFMKKMNKLKVLIITNYDFHRADLENFELLDYLSELRRIRLEKVSIPFLSKTGVQLKNLLKFSFFMCNVNDAFKNSTIKVSNVLPNLEEMNIDYCDMVELPVGLSDIVSLKKLSITNCHKLSALPEGIGNLVNLESLRLTSCTNLEELPDSITSLHKLKFLDISDCVSLGKLPENMGELHSLKRLNCRGCTRLKELPYSITELGGLRVVVCDEETAALWEPFKTLLSDLEIKVAQVDFNLNWLL